MRKTAYAKILVLAFLFLVEAQVLIVLANPYGLWPWLVPESRYPDWGYPEITVTSPVQNGTYAPNNVWLNLTVTKPSNWTDFEGQIKYVVYLIDGNRSNFINYDYYGATRISNEDPPEAVNPPLEFSFSIKLEGLSEGNHHIEVAAEGLVEYKGSDVTVSGYADTINFIVTKESSASSTTLAAAVSGASATIIGLGVLVYFKKRKR
jgi:hypothetical protein